jgi:hypothetical protein
MDLDYLLRTTSSVPLGPLNLEYAASGIDEWRLTVTLAERRRTIQAEREPVTEGLVLTCKLDTGIVESAPRGAWVTQDDSALDGSMARRIWLHGDGLMPALLLNALAELARVAAPDPAPADDEPESALPLTPAETPLLSEPAPTPAPRTKLLPWQRLDTAPKEPALVETTADPAAVLSTESSPAQVGADAALPPLIPATDTALPAALGEQPASIAPTDSPAPIPPRPPANDDAAAHQALAATQTPPSVTVTPDGSNGRSGTCRECGTPFKADHAFCTNCGIRLE